MCSHAADILIYNRISVCVFFLSPTSIENLFPLITRTILTLISQSRAGFTLRIYNIYIYFLSLHFASQRPDFKSCPFQDVSNVSVQKNVFRSK